jgi:hypothetical protein
MLVHIAAPPPRSIPAWIRLTKAWNCAGKSKRINLYFGQETQQSWRPRKQGLETDGAAIWLPNNALVEIQMIPPQSRGSSADSDEGMEDNVGKGLLITFSWAVNPNTIIGRPSTL